MKLNELRGEVLTHIDEIGSVILLTTKTGRRIKIYHEQDCCENVYLESTEGKWEQLLGKQLKLVKRKEESRDVASYTSCTNTELIFTVDGHTVISRWYGESKGCYSESVDIKDITNLK